MKLSNLILLYLILYANMVSAQDEITIDDYQRAVGYLYENYNNKKAFNLNIRANWFSDSSGVWYVHQSLENKKYLKVILPDLVQSELFDHQKLAQILSDSLDTDIESNNLPISNIEYVSPVALNITSMGKTFLLKDHRVVACSAVGYELSKKLRFDQRVWLKNHQLPHLYL